MSVGLRLGAHQSVMLIAQYERVHLFVRHAVFEPALGVGDLDL